MGAILATRARTGYVSGAVAGRDSRLADIRPARAVVAFLSMILLWQVWAASDAARAPIEQSAPSVSWSSPAITASARRGTSSTEALSLNVTASASDVSMDISPSLSGLIAPFDVPDPYDLSVGSEYFPITFDVPTAAPLGLRTGSVTVRSSTGEALAELTVDLEVTEPARGVVPPSVAEPASSRIGTDEEGLPVVLDQLLVGIDSSAPDPEQRILAIAGSHNAIVIGSIPDFRMYQLMVDVSDLAQLEIVRQAIGTEANVVFASMSFLGSTK